MSHQVPKFAPVLYSQSGCPTMNTAGGDITYPVSYISLPSPFSVVTRNLVSKGSKSGIMDENWLVMWCFILPKKNMNVNSVVEGSANMPIWPDMIPHKGEKPYKCDQWGTASYFLSHLTLLCTWGHILVRNRIPVRCVVESSVIIQPDQACEKSHRWETLQM